MQTNENENIGAETLVDAPIYSHGCGCQRKRKIIAYSFLVVTLVLGVQQAIKFIKDYAKGN